jgi:uncharacterized protein YjbI with pentapeptide repeats
MFGYKLRRVGMKKHTTFSKKVGFVMAVAAAAVVGGATTAFVTAAIPSSNDGLVHGCYRNNASLTDAKGSLRVIDSDASQTCTTQETALSWNQSRETGGFKKNLVGAYFGNMDLSYRDFSGANMSNMFSAGQIDQSDFRGANLSGATLQTSAGSLRWTGNADFRNVNFTGAVLISLNVDARGANFTNASLQGILAGNYSGNNFTAMQVGQPY